MRYPTPDSRRKQAATQRRILLGRKDLLCAVAALMLDGCERSSYEIAICLQRSGYEIAMCLNPDEFSRPFWWQVAAALESEAFHPYKDLNRPNPNSLFNVRHDGRKWIYRIKPGLF